MFGGKNRVNADELKALKDKLESNEEYFKKTSNTREVYAAERVVVEDSRNQLEAEITQVDSNVVAVIEYGTSNVQTQASMIHDFTELRDEMQGAEEELDSLKEKVDMLYKGSQDVVEGNKHFTTPSKTLTDISQGFKNQNQLYEKQLKLMSDNCKQMGVLALNAAIEAGRMGESGKKFVNAAEEIRSFAGVYDVLIEKMHQEINESENKIQQLEEQIGLVVGLLKDSNVTAVKHMKDCQEAVKYMDNMSNRDFSKDIENYKEKILGMKNQEEEVLKYEERNRLQLEDMVEELKTQRKQDLEIEEKLKVVFQYASDNQKQEEE